jgi:hypothetical protein
MPELFLDRRDGGGDGGRIGDIKLDERRGPGGLLRLELCESFRALFKGATAYDYVVFGRCSCDGLGGFKSNAIISTYDVLAMILSAIKVLQNYCTSDQYYYFGTHISQIGDNLIYNWQILKLIQFSFQYWVTAVR